MNELITQWQVYANAFPRATQIEVLDSALIVCFPLVIIPFAIGLIKLLRYKKQKECDWTELIYSYWSFLLVPFFIWLGIIVVTFFEILIGYFKLNVLG